MEYFKYILLYSKIKYFEYVFLTCEKVFGLDFFLVKCYNHGQFDSPADFHHK